MNGARYFFDTNIFIYSVDRSDPEKLAIADQLIRSSLQHGQQFGGLIVTNPFV